MHLYNVSFSHKIISPRPKPGADLHSSTTTATPRAITTYIMTTTASVGARKTLTREVSEKGASEKTMAILTAGGATPVVISKERGVMVVERQCAVEDIRAVK